MRKINGERRNTIINHFFNDYQLFHELRDMLRVLTDIISLGVLLS